MNKHNKTTYHHICTYNAYITHYIIICLFIIYVIIHQNTCLSPSKIIRLPFPCTFSTLLNYCPPPNMQHANNYDVNQSLCNCTNIHESTCTNIQSSCTYNNIQSIDNTTYIANITTKACSCNVEINDRGGCGGSRHIDKIVDEDDFPNFAENLLEKGEIRIDNYPCNISYIHVIKFYKNLF